MYRREASVRKEVNVLKEASADRRETDHRVAITVTDRVRDRARDRADLIVTVSVLRVTETVCRADRDSLQVMVSVVQMVVTEMVRDHSIRMVVATVADRVRMISSAAVSRARVVLQQKRL